MMHIGHSLVAVASLVEHGLSGRGAWTAERILTHYATRKALCSSLYVQDSIKIIFSFVLSYQFDT